MGLVAYLVCTSLPVISQTKDGFNDTNNYDLRRMPGYDPEGNSLPDVNQPAFGQKPTLATPKSVKTQYDPVASIPGAGSFNPAAPLAANQQINPQTVLQGRNSVINPLTGEVNPGAFQDQQQRSKNKKEAQQKLREEFDDEEVYQETAFRRGSIIFFLTFPFALGFSAGMASLLPTALEKGILGSGLILSGSLGLSGTNVYLDKERLEQHRETKKALAKTNP